MTLRISADGHDIPVEHIRFSDGGSNLRIAWPNDIEITGYVCISVDPSTNVDASLFEILMARQFIKDKFNDGYLWEATRHLKLILCLPYLPHGRADRRFEPNCATPLQTFMGTIGALFDEIVITDPHSNAAVQFLGHKITVFDQAACFKSMKIIGADRRNTFLISPDKGAMEKIHKVSEVCGWLGVICAEKVRNVSTGRIESVSLPTVDITDARCVIVDDICDGGGTFIPLATELLNRGAKTVELYVTHGIFSKKLTPFEGIISKLHVYQIVSNYVSTKDIETFNSTTFQRPL